MSKQFEHIGSILHHTGISKEVYFNLFFELGMDYLEYSMQGDKKGIEMLSQYSDGLFWSWWKSVWNSSDRGYLSEIDSQLSKQQCRFCYVQMKKHSIEDVQVPSFIYKYSFNNLNHESVNAKKIR